MSHDQTQQDQIWAHHCRTVRDVLQSDQLSDNLIREALTAAHRDKESDYQSDGNRYGLASTGITTIQGCIRLAKSSGNDYARSDLWVRLESKPGLREVVQRSPLRSCLVPSIRQNSDRNNDPWPVRVATYALRALIAAVHKANDYDLGAVCPTLDALCAYLEGDENANEGNRSLPTPPPSSNDEDSPNNSAWSSEAASYIDPAIDTSLLDQMIMENMDIPHSPIASTGLNQISDAAGRNSSFADDISTSMENMSIAHTNHQNQQAFTPVKLRTIGHVTSKDRNKDSEEPRTAKHGHKRKISNVALCDYVEDQRLQVSDMDQALTGKLSLHLDLDTSIIHLGKPGQTLLKMHHAFVSPLAILNVKEILASKYVPSQVQQDDISNCKAAYHYKQVKFNENYQTASSFWKLYHTYRLYTSLRDSWQTEKDSGFVHNDSMTCGPSKGKQPKIAGSPLKRNASLNLDHMLHIVEPSFRDMSPDEQYRLTSEIKTLKDVGQRLDLLVQELGLGVFALISFLHPAHERYRGAFYVTQSEFSKVPYESFKDYIKTIKGDQFPLVDFARTAKVAFDMITEAASDESVSLVCQKTEVAVIMKLTGGSNELCAQLERSRRQVSSHF